MVVRDKQSAYSEDFISVSSQAQDAMLPVLAKVSALMEGLRLGGCWELVHQLWAQFTLTASRENIDVTWSRDELVVVNFLFHISTYPCASASQCYF